MHDVIAVQLGTVDGSRQSPGAPCLTGEGPLDLAKPDLTITSRWQMSSSSGKLRPSNVRKRNEPQMIMGCVGMWAGLLTLGG